MHNRPLAHSVPLPTSGLDLALLVQIKIARKFRIDIEKETKNVQQKNLARKPRITNIIKER